MTPSLAEIHAAFGEALALDSYDPVDLALATLEANRFDGDPVWTIIVSPPSNGKTEILRTLDGAPDVFFLSTLTPQTFASGLERKGVETSLLPKLDGKTLVMKDLTSVLELHRDKRAEIFSQLREIYDGAYFKQWGTGKGFSWSGKVGLLAGVTPVIDRFYSLNQVLGERFVLFRIKAAPARDMARRALAGRRTQAEHRRALRELVGQFLAALPAAAPGLPPDILEAVAATAEFASLARSPVFFDNKGEVEFLPGPEGPARLAKSLALLAQGLAAVRSEPEVSTRTFLTLLQVAHDCVPAQRRVMLEALLNRPATDTMTTTAVAEATRYPTSTARRHLQELNALTLVDRTAGGDGKADLWCPSQTLLNLLDAMREPLTTCSVTSGGIWK